MPPLIKLILIIILPAISYFYLRPKLPFINKQYEFIILFGVFFIFLGSLMVLSFYDRNTLIQSVLLKETVFLDRFILIGYSIIIFGFLAMVDNTISFFTRKNSSGKKSH
jgi:hypothetical protein